ncbi:hypothetical protein KP509_24G020300 [Ceratopteris richardii]|uniref:Uncharacterized protein n=1 Tax=Ceratopteris richardii TaxID=49495 RepID=A0A8T2RV32_CERRI|nr:hypothetical protein KP509_24G020300 [Ceratopteris richardii]
MDGERFCERGQGRRSPPPLNGAPDSKPRVEVGALSEGSLASASSKRGGTRAGRRRSDEHLPLSAVEGQRRPSGGLRQPFPRLSSTPQPHPPRFSVHMTCT